MYYSGQGIVYAAERNTDGTPKGFITLGNIPKLELSVEITKFEHKESMSGQRAIDLTIVQEKKGTFTMTMEDMSPSNLAMAFWGTAATQASGAVSNVELVAQVHATMDLRVPIMNVSTGAIYPGLTTVTVGDDATPTITYEFGTTEGAAGSKNGYVDLANGVLVIFSTAKQTARTAANMIAQDDPLFVDAVGSSAQTITHAFTQTSQERWLRFEGLNTIDNKSVIIDLFKASLDPLSGYALLNEEIGSFDVSGSLLYDALQPGTSKFFRQVNVG